MGRDPGCKLFTVYNLPIYGFLRLSSSA